MLDVVGNPEARFSRNAAHLMTPPWGESTGLTCAVGPVSYIPVMQEPAVYHIYQHAA